MSEKIRDSFIFYRSFYQSAKKLPKEDKAELFDAICSYALDGESVEMSVVPEAIFTVIKPNLDANRRKWENGCKEKKKSSESEAEEDQEISKDEANDKQTISKAQGNVNVDVNDNEECKSELKSKSESKRFFRPTLQEVSDYCQERKNTVNPQKWINHYESNGWKVGKNSMKDWKAAVRTWEGNSFNSTPKPETTKDSFCQDLNQSLGQDLIKSLIEGEIITIKLTGASANDKWDALSQDLKESVLAKVKAKFGKETKISF